MPNPAEPLHSSAKRVYDRVTVDLDAPTDTVIAGLFRENDGYLVRRSGGSSSWLLIATLAGRGRIAAGGEERIAEAGSLALWRPGTPQFYRADGPWHLAWAHFTPPARFAPALDWPEESPGFSWSSLDAEELAAARGSLDPLEDEWTRGPAGIAICFSLLESVLWRGRRAAGDSGRDPRVRRAVRWLLSEEPFTAEGLGRAMDLSPSRAAHVFSDAMGEPPRRFRERHRLERARGLLRATGRSVKEIAREAGFENEFYFSRRYRERYGLPPSAERAHPE